MTYGYIRVSTDKQTTDNQKNEILNYAHSNKLSIDEFISFEISSRKSKSERGIDELINRLNKNDVLIVSELSRLGRSTVEVLGIIDDIVKKSVSIHFIKQGLKVSNDNKDLTSKVMITLFSLFAELERDLISNRTREALASRKKKGVKLGHKEGDLLPSKYDERSNEILELLNKGVNITTIIKLIGFGTRQTLTNWKIKRVEKSELLQELVFNDKYRNFLEARKGKIRSKTFPGIEKAMAEQWAGKLY